MPITSQLLVDIIKKSLTPLSLFLSITHYSDLLLNLPFPSLSDPTSLSLSYVRGYNLFSIFATLHWPCSCKSMSPFHWTS